MEISKKIEELKHAHEHGFLSDEDFEKRLAILSTNEPEIIAETGQFIERVLQSDMVLEIADGSKSLVKQALQSDIAADMATAAVAGAVIASVVPFVGTGAGAIAGAAFGAYKNFTKKP
ncbi:MAG: hypothetical protein LUQ18_09400 [Methylococcaceae bacterium]|nr:hypothetical protein [Methylococcaceae bacterium]